MIGYKSAIWKLEYPVYFVKYSPMLYRPQDRYAIRKVVYLSKTKTTDYFEYTLDGAMYPEGIAYKNRFFRTREAAYKGLIRLLREDYDSSLSLIKALKDVKECV